MDTEQRQPVQEKRDGIGAEDPLRTIRVLLAEDDHDIREALVAVLESDGCEVHAARSGSELLERLGGWLLEEDPEPPADIIITDVRMPGFDGLSIVDGLRAYGWPLPVIIISAFADDEMRAKVAGIRSAALMEKPLDMERLRSTMLRLTGRKER
jgi:CheY-like chemotaxis protein